MTVEEFQRLADTWGADLTRWPDAVRAEAEALAREPQALAILDQARQLDRAARSLAPQVGERRVANAMHAVMVRLAPEQPRLAAEQARLAAEQARLAPEQAPRRGKRFSLLHWFVPAAGFAGAATLGVLLGLAYPIERLAAPHDASAVLVFILDSDSAAPEWMLQ